jgi:hypothetical protein
VKNRASTVKAFTSNAITASRAVFRRVTVWPMERNYKVTTRHRVAERISGRQIVSHLTLKMEILAEFSLGGIEFTIEVERPFSNGWLKTPAACVIGHRSFEKKLDVDE